MVFSSINYVSINLSCLTLFKHIKMIIEVMENMLRITNTFKLTYKTWQSLKFEKIPVCKLSTWQKNLSSWLQQYKNFVIHDLTCIIPYLYSFFSFTWLYFEEEYISVRQIRLRFWIHFLGLYNIFSYILGNLYLFYFSYIFSLTIPKHTHL